MDHELSGTPHVSSPKVFDSQQMERVRILEQQVKELMHVNGRWDLEYREQEDAFRRYRMDSQLAQKESQEIIAHLRADNESLKEEIKQKVQFGKGAASMGSRPRDLPVNFGSTNRQTLRVEEEMQTELALLKHQLKVYQEDFETERREKNKLIEEKQSERLRLQAEITSLQLQLDRCRSELTHYSKEATRLSQQLHLQLQKDQEKYKSYLESKGYVPRSPGASLPPLDPFVEADHTHHVSLHLSPDHPPAVHALNSYYSSVGREASQVSALENKIKYSCPRCARAFVEMKQLENHKMKCLQY